MAGIAECEGKCLRRPEPPRLLCLTANALKKDGIRSATRLENSLDSPRQVRIGLDSLCHFALP
jgi:hypothetical protein